MAASLQLIYAATCLVLISQYVTPTDSARVLVIPFNHKSHVNIFTTLGHALQDADHEVWVLTITKFSKMVDKHHLNPLIFDIPKEADFNLAIEEIMADKPGGTITTDEMDFVFPAFGRYCDEVMTNKLLMQKIRDIKFDLVVLDGLSFAICMYMIPYIYDVPFITLHGFQVVSWSAGVTGLPSIEPELETHFSNRMDFWQRLENLKAWRGIYMNPISDALSESHMEKYAGKKPKITFDELVSRSEMFLLNFEIMCLDYPRVSAPNYQFLGASTASPPKALSADLEKFVSGAEHGVIVMSLGTMKAFHSAWIGLQDKVFPAFGRLKQRVVVQYTLDRKVDNVPDNVRILKWLPQNDLLGHPNTKLFVTHGGNNGQNEAVYHGIPSLVIPIAADQAYAGERVVAHGYGKHVKDRNSVTEDELYDMMTEIIYNETYTKNIKKCSAIVRSMPSAPERFVFWVNHILQFGGAHLRPPSLDMPLYQILMLDIVAYYVVSGLVMFHATLFVIWYLYCKFFRGPKAKKD